MSFFDNYDANGNFIPTPLKSYDRNGQYIDSSNYKFNPDFMPSRSSWEKPSYLAILQNREREAHQADLDNIRNPKPTEFEKTRNMIESLREIKINSLLESKRRWDLATRINKR